MQIKKIEPQLPVILYDQVNFGGNSVQFINPGTIGCQKLSGTGFSGKTDSIIVPKNFQVILRDYCGGISFNNYAKITGPATISNLEDIGFERNKVLWLDILEVGSNPVQLFLHYNYFGDILEIHPKEN